MACLCAPTTHEGSFRCRLHRVPPLLTNSAQLASLPPQKGAFAGSLPPPPTISDHPCRIRAREALSPAAARPVHCNFPSSSPSPALAVSHPVHCNLASSSSSSTAVAASPPSTSPSHCAPRPPPAKRAILSSTSLSRSLYPGSSKSELSSATRCTTGPSASHAAALAIMKQHSHNNKPSKSHGSRNMDTVLRSPAGAYKIGPSRLSRMGRAPTADELPLLKKVTPNPPAQKMLSTSFNSGEAQSTRVTSMDATHINFKMHSAIAKFKQSESSCKIVGYKAGPFIMPTVY
ncbi:hypothetical protein GOP47_0005200 [Adiantum capillus-veneris]|uniref:Uncharacterized protein n=1 Tax=Adiantum capillus-veneris TaxID=13818 RepID=A0A9D4ZND7_ADICA|nr:hypothetical protein GOP47_0005200 [Adiantum capillus-veneris]